MRSALALCDRMGRFLFEARPDLLPEGYLTETETLLWGRFFEAREAAQSG